MALLYVDQFVGYETTGIVENPLPYLGVTGWTYARSDGPGTVIDSWARLKRETLPGQNYEKTFLDLINNDIDGYFRISRSIAPSAAYICVGFSYAVTNAFNTNRVIAAFNTTFTASEVTDSVAITPAGEIRCNGQISSAGVFTPYCYLNIVCDTAAGEIRVYKDNDVTTPVLTAATAISSISLVSFGFGHAPGNNGSVQRISDMYILDDTGPAPFNAPLGIVQYKPLPLVAEDNADFVPMGGAANNLAAINKDTRTFDTYNRSQASNGLYDRYTVDPSAVESSDDVLGVVLHTSALRDVGEPRTMALELNDAGGTLHEDFSDLTVGAWTDNRYSVFQTQGDGTSPWTPADLTGIKVGYKAKA